MPELELTPENVAAYKEFAELCGELATPLMKFLNHPFVPLHEAGVIADAVLEIYNVTGYSMSKGGFARHFLLSIKEHFAGAELELAYDRPETDEEEEIESEAAAPLNRIM